MAQADYIVSNGTGAAVRSDINGQLAAIVSNNSGATSPATTYAYQWWADTTTNTLKLRNSANSAWIELRQLDGDFTTVSVDNGTAAAPSIYFNASGTDTGIFSSGTDAVDISTAGTRRFGIASGGDITVFGGNVTLNAQGDLRFADSDSSNFIALQAPATISSNVTLTLPSADGSNGQVLTTNGSGTLSFTSAGGTSDKISEGNTEAEVVDTGSDGHFKVTTEGTERMRITSIGEVKLNTGVPIIVPYAYATTTASAANAFIGTDGNIFRSTSSRRWKTSIEDLQPEYADNILNCRPVWYRSTSNKDNPDWGYWGFIAEEVAEIDPRLVFWKTHDTVKEEDGKQIVVELKEPLAEGVQYDRFVPHLLNLIKRQKDQIEAMEARLTALEAA